MKVEQQNTRLPIKNFEFEGGSLRKKHGKLFPNNIRALIIGPSNSGKTNLMLTLLVDKNGLRFENVYLFSKSLNQAKYRYLEKILRGVKNVGFFKFADKVISPQEVARNSIIIFDDLITNKQAAIQDFFSMGRHRSLDSFYLGQTYSRIPKQLIRDNANMIVLFKTDELNMKHVHSDHVGSDLEFREFREVCDTCWKEPHGFLVIDKESPKNAGGYRKGFDNYIRFDNFSEEEIGENGEKNQK